MRGYPQRVLLSLACFVALAALAGCPPRPNPPIGPPDASDAAPVPPPAPVSCDTACAHAAAVCPGSASVCGPICNRLGATYARCIGAATACEGPTGLGACDALHGAAGAAKPIGR